MEAVGGLAKVGRECAGTCDDIEQDVPLGPQNHQRTEPDIGVQAVTDDYQYEHRKGKIGGKRGQELRERLNPLG